MTYYLRKYYSIDDDDQKNRNNIYIRDQKQVEYALSDCYQIQNNMSTIIGEKQGIL